MKVRITTRVRKTSQEIFDKIIESLRKSIKEMEDFRLSVRLAAAIASCTKNQRDIEVAISIASEHGSRSLRAEAMAIVVKTLAEGFHLEQARSVVRDMKGLDAYWIAESWIWIVRFSGWKADEERAQEAISHINTPSLRNEARTDLNHLLECHHHTGVQKDKKHLSDLKALQEILSGLAGMEDSHIVSPRFTSAHLRLKASEVIDRLFADAMK